jgi:putative acetyltransferase
MIHIISSTPDHGDRVIAIWRDAVDATHDFLSPEDRRAIDAEVCDFLPAAPLWLARSEAGTILGFMLLTPTEAGAHMDALFVDPAAHGQGVGRSLVEHAIARHGAITTDVNAQNPGALGFYRAMGFVETGRSALDDQGRAYPLIHLSRPAETPGR